MDVSEVFERVEIRLMSLLNYDPDLSQKLNIAKIRQASKQLASNFDIRSLSDIANSFLQSLSGAQIFQCLSIIAEHGLAQSEIVEESGYYVRLINAIHLAGTPVSKELILKLPPERLIGVDRHIWDYLMLTLTPK